MQRGAGRVAAEDDEVDLNIGRQRVRMGAKKAPGIAGADGQNALS